jgi:hypothetical protein
MDPFLKAKSIRCIENTLEVQELINNITLEDLKKPATWKKLHSICLIKPDNDVLPFRSRYALKDDHLRGVPQARTIGINYVTSVDGSAWWWTIQDAIASKLKTGKAPIIEKAITFEPVGVQEGLKEIQIINGITVKPDEDIFKKVIEERIRIKKRMGEIEASNPEYKKNQEWNTLNSTQAGLKTIANSGAYGIFLQLNPEPTEALVDVYGLTHIKSQVDKLEVPGPMFNPIIGIFQTAGARLMLAAVEALLDQHGGYYAGCDTDSMFVSPQHAQMIQDFFQPLNPYDVDVPVFKIDLSAVTTFTVGM